MKRSRRLSNAEITMVREVIVRLKALPDYAPSNSRYTLAALLEAGEAMEQAEEAFVLAEQQVVETRDTAHATKWDAYELVQGVKAQIVAQYGDDSPAMQAVGLKQKSDYKRTGQRKPKNATP